MVLTPTLVIPDEQSWTTWGRDPGWEGLEPTLDVARARRVRVAEGFVALARAELEPTGLDFEEIAVPGLRAVQWRGPAETSEETSGHHDEHEDEDEDMMAITGEPSADGLVMEPIEFTLGPLGSPLPGGLMVDLVLDGDVVAECHVRAGLRQSAGPSASPDMLAPAAWSAAQLAQAGLQLTDRDRWLSLASAELERAISHLAWLRALARLLGWSELVMRACALISGLGPARAGRVLQADAAARAVAATLPDADALARFCSASRRFASRTAARGVVGRDGARSSGLAGPAARASGIGYDARQSDERYRRLGFEPAVRDDGDARARALLRLDEACHSLRLASRALGAAERGSPAPPAAKLVEGPRGPLIAGHAPGEAAARRAAGTAAVGLEWASALVVLLSFDLSPWKVGP